MKGDFIILYKTDSIFILNNNNNDNIFSNSFWIDLIPGLIGVIIGSILTFLITRYFHSREETRQGNIIWYSTKEEITTNYNLATRWLKKVNEEIDSKGSRDYPFPNRTFKTNFSFGNSYIYSIPEKLKKDPEFFNVIRQIHDTFELANEIILKVEEDKKLISYNKKADKKDIENIYTMNKSLKDYMELIIKMINYYYEDLIISTMKLHNELDNMT